VFDDKKEKVGARTIKMELGIVINLKKIRRIMKKYDLVCKIRKVNKARVALQKNLENRYVYNLLNRQFRKDTPYRFASTDITYIRHCRRFSFLSVVKDIATGEVLTWKLSREMNLKLVIDTIENLERYFRNNKLDLSRLLLHSDQGFQYTNLEYYNKLKELRIIQSMSRRGNSVDNAPIESFFGHLKDEIEYKHLNFSELENLISEYMIEYNYERKQWGRQSMAPVFYRDYLLDFAE
jgi:transposase InsO family protein